MPYDFLAHATQGKLRSDGENPDALALGTLGRIVKVTQVVGDVVQAAYASIRSRFVTMMRGP